MFPNHQKSTCPKIQLRLHLFQKAFYWFCNTLISIHMTTVYLIGSGHMRMNYGFYLLVSFFSPIPNRLKKTETLYIYLLVFFTDRDLVDRSWRKERKRERERAVSLGLCGKPIKPIGFTGVVPLTKAQGVLSRRSWKPGRESELCRFPHSNENEDKAGCRGPRSLVDQGYFISRNAGSYIFSKMTTQLLQRMKFHRLQQNG